MKRLVALIGVFLLLVGLRFYDAGLLRIAGEGSLTVFAESEYSPEMFVPTGADCYRIDLIGAENVQKILGRSNAKIVFTEMEGKLIYAYSARISAKKWVHGKRINIMIYADGDYVCAGVPILKGSY